MMKRTKRFTAHMPKPFTLNGIEDVQPAGDYAVEQDEELIEGISFVAYRRVATFITLPAISAGSALLQSVTIDPDELSGGVLEDRI